MGFPRRHLHSTSTGAAVVGQSQLSQCGYEPSQRAPKRPFQRNLSSVSRMASHRQTWPLSQDAHKSSGICSECHAVRQIHLKSGTIHRHGPRNNPCSGSDKPPQSTNFVPTQLTTPITIPSPTLSSQVVSPSSITIASSLSNTSTKPSTFAHPPAPGGLIKHIPKSARPACGIPYWPDT